MLGVVIHAKFCCNNTKIYIRIVQQKGNLHWILVVNTKSLVGWSFWSYCMMGNSYCGIWYSLCKITCSWNISRKDYRWKRHDCLTGSRGYPVHVPSQWKMTLHCNISHWHLANERQCYIATSSLISWAHTENDPCGVRPIHPSWNILSLIWSNACFTDAYMYHSASLFFFCFFCLNESLP